MRFFAAALSAFVILFCSSAQAQVTKIRTGNNVVQIGVLSDPDVNSLSGSGALPWGTRPDIPLTFTGLHVDLYNATTYRLLSGELVGPFVYEMPRVPNMPVDGALTIFTTSFRLNTDRAAALGTGTWTALPTMVFETEEDWFGAAPGDSLLGAAFLKPVSKETVVGAIDLTLETDKNYLLLDGTGFRAYMAPLFSSDSGPEFTVQFPSLRGLKGAADQTIDSSSLIPLSGGEIVVQATSGAFDLDLASTPASLGLPDEWRGLYLSDLEVSFNAGEAMRLVGEDLLQPSPASGDAWIDEQGLRLDISASAIDKDFKLFGHDATLQQLKLSIDETGEVSANSILAGELHLSFQSESKSYEFSFALDQVGTSETALISGLLPDSDKTFAFGADTARIFSLTTANADVTINDKEHTILLDFGDQEPPVSAEITFEALAATLEIGGSPIFSGQRSISTNKTTVIKVTSFDGTVVEYKVSTMWNQPETEAEPESSAPPAPLLLLPADGETDVGVPAVLSYSKGASTPSGTTLSVFVCDESDFSGAGCDEAVCSETVATPPLQTPPQNRPWAPLGLLSAGALLLLVIGKKREIPKRIRLPQTLPRWSALLAFGILAACSGDPADSESDIPESGPGECVVTSLDPDTRYYWKVVAQDEDGEETDSEIYDFTTESR